MQYYLRCIAPVCIEDEARQFDERMMETAMDKLGLDEDERTGRTTELLQRKLRDGGWGPTPAARTSPAAFIGSLATCHGEASFVTHCSDTPLPSTSRLHGWIDDSMQRVRQAAPGEQYQADIEPLLPNTAGDFFRFGSTAEPSATTTLQRSLNAKANKTTIEAAVQQMRQQSRQGEKRPLAHHWAITAKGAWGWKAVQPESPQLRLSDVEYAVAARLNLGLRPFPRRAVGQLPMHCPLCSHRHTGAPIPLQSDAWHWLSCVNTTKGEVTRRHDAVADAIGRLAWQVGAQVRREVEGLNPDNRQRPDVQFPGRTLLADISVSHSLTPSQITNGSAAASQQSKKNAKYAAVASRLGAELLNLAVDSCGGMAIGASKLIEAIGDEGARWSAGTWTATAIERQLLGAIATAVQRGNALAMLSGYTRAAMARARQTEDAKVGSAARKEGEGESERE